MDSFLAACLRRYQWSQAVDRPHLKQLDLWLREAREGRASERAFSIPVKDALQQIESDQPEVDKRRFAEV